MQLGSLGQEDPPEEEMAPAPVFSPRRSRRQRSLADCSPWDLKEPNKTEHSAVMVTNVALSF